METKNKKLQDAGVWVVGRITFFPSRGLGSRVFRSVCEGKAGKQLAAVKQIPNESWNVQRNKRDGKEEDDILCQLRHENVIRYLLTETTPDFTYIACELCQYNLAEWLEKFKFENWESDEKPVLLYQACNGLSYLHKNNIIHRDIKPENILVNQISEQSIKISGKSQFQVKISDFGISRVIKDDYDKNVRQNSGSGSKIWMSPEVARASIKESKPEDKLSTAADVFSLGCVKYWLLTDGKHPFQHGNEQSHTPIPMKYTQCIKLSGMKIQHVGAIRLIQQMIAENPEDRPPADAVLEHHFYFKKSDSLEFLKSVSNATETGVPDAIKLNILRNTENSLYKPWTERFEQIVKNYAKRHVGRKRPYDENNVMDLVRFYRNVSYHSSRVPIEVKDMMGLKTDEDYLEKILENFPFLVDDIWLAFQTIKESNKNEYVNIRKKFYKTDYMFRSDLSDGKDPIKAFICSKFFPRTFTHEQHYPPQSALMVDFASIFNAQNSHVLQRQEINRSSEVQLALAKDSKLAYNLARTRHSPYQLPNRFCRTTK